MGVVDALFCSSSSLISSALSFFYKRYGILQLNSSTSTKIRTPTPSIIWKGISSIVEWGSTFSHFPLATSIRCFNNFRTTWLLFRLVYLSGVALSTWNTKRPSNLLKASWSSFLWIVLCYWSDDQRDLIPS